MEEGSLVGSAWFFVVVGGPIILATIVAFGIVRARRRGKPTGPIENAGERERYERTETTQGSRGR